MTCRLFLWCIPRTRPTVDMCVSMPALYDYAKRQITFNSNVFLMSAANICQEFWLASVCACGNYSLGKDGGKPSYYATKTLKDAC